MPKIDWIGKDAVKNHHNKVSYRLLHCDKSLSVGDASAGNLLVRGDNLEALKTLLPYYKGKVKCIYIDPPYNTGNEGWKYNDNVNNPQIDAWINEVVGKRGEDLCRHDKWLCMMYPRLRLLREFLRDDGAIFVSIDDNEHHRLSMMMDEIFGVDNFVSQFVWHKKNVVQNDAKFASVNHEYVLCYRRSGKLKSFNLAARDVEADAKNYKNPDDDPRGVWQSVALHAKSGDVKSVYSVKFGNGVKWSPPDGTYPKFTRERLLGLYEEGRLWFGKGGKNVPRLKKFLHEVQQGMVTNSLLPPELVGSTQFSTELLKGIMGGSSVFPSPKPPQLVQRLISLVADEDSIILDSFAGSGTTAHAVLALNKADNGNRRFILVECEDYADDITAKRIKRVIEGYSCEKGGTELMKEEVTWKKLSSPAARDSLLGRVALVEEDNAAKYEDIKVEIKKGVLTVVGRNKESKKTPGLGGGFRYCYLGGQLFDEEDRVSGDVKFSDLAAHVFFSETGVPIPRQGKKPFLGSFGGKSVYLLYNGIMGDGGSNMLTEKTLRKLGKLEGGKGEVRVVYAEGIRLSEDIMLEENIVFKQTPYRIKRR